MDNWDRLQRYWCLVLRLVLLNVVLLGLEVLLLLLLLIELIGGIVNVVLASQLKIRITIIDSERINRVIKNGV